MKARGKIEADRADEQSPTTKGQGAGGRGSGELLEGRLEKQKNNNTRFIRQTRPGPGKWGKPGRERGAGYRGGYRINPHRLTLPTPKLHVQGHVEPGSILAGSVLGT